MHVQAIEVLHKSVENEYYFHFRISGHQNQPFPLCNTVEIAPPMHMHLHDFIK